MKEVKIYTDGACSGNPGPGGWGTVLVHENGRKELSGYEPDTTNNRMELLAVIQGLSSLKEPCKVTVTSDSQYVVNAINKDWLFNWVKRDWNTASGTPVKNPDLWKEILPLLSMHEITFVWVKGHTGHPENERCDALAVACYQSNM